MVLTDSTSSLLHWGLLTVFDHEYVVLCISLNTVMDFSTPSLSRGKLRCGEQILYLWEKNEDSNKTRRYSESYFGPILAGPATNNPAQNAVKVVVTLPDQKVFHLYTKENRDTFM